MCPYVVPKFKVRVDNNITMFENKPVIFKCRLSSKKVAANITWFKDGQSVSEAYPSYKVTSLRWGSRLRIRRAKAKDAGIFQCRAKGPGGTATAHAWLKINGFLNTPPITSTVHLIICADLRIDYDYLSKCLNVHCSNYV